MFSFSAPRVVVLVLAALWTAGDMPLAQAANPNTRVDPVGDAVARRTDPGADGPLNPAEHALPDLVAITTGAWQPDQPRTDLFKGAWQPNGAFLRLDVVFVGVVNPPGPLACCGDPAFEPFRYGPNPVYGTIELDADADVNTGGELEAMSFRYLGNVARFGGLPTGPRFMNRVAHSARQIDGNLNSPPFVERSGEEFSLQIAPWEVNGTEIRRSDNTDMIFGPGETWVLTGCFFHRAHGYRKYSSGCCRAGAPIGSYEPKVQLRWQHDASTDQTTLSLVYPLTNTASALMRGDSNVEPNDAMFTNQNSVLEALMELKLSAQTATIADRSEPAFQLIAPWESKNPAMYLNPSAWEVTALVGTGYLTPQGNLGLFVWTDTWPNVLRGDLNGNGEVNAEDIALFSNFLQNNDGRPGQDADGSVNGKILIIDFGPNFSLYDLNADGVISTADRDLIQAPITSTPDFDGDNDADQSDFGLLQRCLTGPGPGVVPISPDCTAMDLDRDHDVDKDDVAIFRECARGPGISLEPAGCFRPQPADGP